jgi:hypothetical protein
MADKAAFNGKWIHITFTYDSAAKHRNLYINGIKMYESDAVNALQDLFKGDYELGCYSADTDNNGRHFKGAMEEFRVYNRVLTQDEAVALTAEGGGAEVTLTAPSASATSTSTATSAVTTSKPTNSPSATIMQITLSPDMTDIPKVVTPDKTWFIWVLVAVVIIGGGAYVVLNKRG